MSKKIHSALLRKTKSNLPTLHSVIKSNGVCHLERRPDNTLFDHLSRTVAGQQLSKAAASTIWSRIEKMCQDQNCSVYEFSKPDNFDRFRSCGLSKFKAKAIIELREALDDGSVSNDIFTTANYEFVISEITKLWGFGAWSAEMTALFFFAHPDVWSTGDAALSRGLRTIASKDKVTEGEILSVTSPYRSFLSMHLWKGIDTKIL